MGSDVKRYYIDLDSDETGSYFMFEDEESFGKWVKFVDYDAAMKSKDAEIAEIKAHNHGIHENWQMERAEKIEANKTIAKQARVIEKLRSQRNYFVEFGSNESLDYQVQIESLDSYIEIIEKKEK